MYKVMIGKMIGIRTPSLERAQKGYNEFKKQYGSDAEVSLIEITETKEEITLCSTTV